MKKKGLNRGLNRGLNVRGTNSKLSKEQQEVLYLLTKEFLTPKQVTIRRQTSTTATYNILNKLREKGVIDSKFKGVEKNRMHYSTPPKNQIRLHAQEFNINLLFKDERYKELKIKSNIVNIDGNTIKLNRNSIEVYSGASFYGKTANKAYSKSVLYFKRLFLKIENDLKIIILKDRKNNIKEVYSEYSETNNELSEDMEKKAEKIKVLAKEDKKTWLKVDNSFNLHEMETCHPETSKGDMQNVVSPVFNDLRDNYTDREVPVISDILKVIKELANNNKETAIGLNAVVELMKPKKEEPLSKPKGRPDYIG